MFTDRLKELESLRARAAALELQVAEVRNRELAALPARYGFESVDDLIDALRKLSGGKARRGPGRPPKATGVVPKRRRRRAKITDETRAQLKKLVGQGKTGNEIAKELGISLPSVQNIKKALGLVQQRRT